LPAFCLRPNVIEIPLANSVALPSYAKTDISIYINGDIVSSYMVSQVKSVLYIILGRNAYHPDKVRLNFINTLSLALGDWLDVQIVSGSTKQSMASPGRFGQYLKTSAWDAGYSYTSSGVTTAVPPSLGPYTRIFSDRSDSCIEKTIIGANLEVCGEVGEVFTAQAESMSEYGMISEILLRSGDQDNFVNIIGNLTPGSEPTTTSWQTGVVSLKLEARGTLTIRLGISSGSGEVDFKNVQVRSNLRNIFYVDPLASTETWISSGSTLPSVDSIGNKYASWRDSFDAGQLETSLVNLSLGKLTIIPEGS